MTIAYNFDYPVGTLEERKSKKIPAGNWFDATPYATRYPLGYHTGLDLNLNKPVWDSDRNAPVYACANGIVTFSKYLYNTWGNLIIIKHELPTGKFVYSRYGHLGNRTVEIGDTVLIGQQIGIVGNASGKFPYHLHFDISTTTILERNPQDWPNLDLKRLLIDYVSPNIFIANNRTVSTKPPFIANRLLVSSDYGLIKRSMPTSKSKNLGVIPRSTELVVLNKPTNGYLPLEDGSGFVIENVLDFITNLEGNETKYCMTTLSRRKQPSIASNFLGYVKADTTVEIVGVERNKHTVLSNKQGWVLISGLSNTF